MKSIFSEENVESMYNILKGDNNDLTKNILRNFIDKLENTDNLDSFGKNF